PPPDQPERRGTLIMAELITPKRCDHCREFAIDFLPWNAPHDRVDMICGACIATYWAAMEADQDDYSL
ncbi:hypothetical protein ACWDYH_39065, partial [Nocardia goodfellowii]